MTKRKEAATPIDSSLVRRIIDAGGELHREGARWRVGQTSEIISGREIRALGAAGVLLGKRSSGLLKVNPVHMPRKLANHLAMIGRTIVYRDNRYDWKKHYAGKVDSRYVRGTVISVAATAFHGDRALVIHPGSPEILVVERPHRQAHWKEVYSESVGIYAPGRPKHDSNVWDRIQKAGMLPAGWNASPIGEPYTLVRLRDVKRLLDMIGAPVVTAEEHVAQSVCYYSPERLDGVRSQAYYARLNSRTHYSGRDKEYREQYARIADVFEAFLQKECAAIEAAEAQAVAQYILRVRENDCWKAGNGSAIERLRAREKVQLLTLEETRKAITKDGYHYSDNAIVMGHAEAIRMDSEWRAKIAERQAKYGIK